MEKINSHYNGITVTHFDIISKHEEVFFWVLFYVRLTAFVMRSFAKAQSFVYIDPKIIQESKTWLENKQQTNGCFKKSGKLFNNRMKVSLYFSWTLILILCGEKFWQHTEITWFHSPGWCV